MELLCFLELQVDEVHELLIIHKLRLLDGLVHILYHILDILQALQHLYFLLIRSFIGLVIFAKLVVVRIHELAEFPEGLHDILAVVQLLVATAPGLVVLDAFAEDDALMYEVKVVNVKRLEQFLTASAGSEQDTLLFLLRFAVGFERDHEFQDLLHITKEMLLGEPELEDLALVSLVRLASYVRIVPDEDH